MEGKSLKTDNGLNREDWKVQKIADFNKRLILIVIKQAAVSLLR